MHALTPLLAVLLWAAPAPADAITKAADQVLQAIAAEDTSKLKALAASSAPGPWLVADELCLHREYDAAEAFAKAAPRKDTAKLPAYVAARRGKEPNRAAREAVAEARQAARPEDALAALDAVRERGDDVGSVRLDYALGRVLEHLRRYEESAKVLRSAAERAERLGWLRRAAASHHLAGKSSYRRADFAGALEAWHGRLRMEQARGDRRGTGFALRSIGTAHRARGELTEAASALERARELHADLGKRGGLGAILGSLANVHADMGDYPGARKLHQESLELMRRWGNRRGELLALSNIAAVLASSGEYLEAVSLLTEALKRLRALGDRRTEAQTLGNLANVRHSLGHFARSLSLHEEALQLKRELGDRRGAAITLGNLASLHVSLGEYERALQLFELSLKIQREIGDRRGEAVSLRSMGGACFWLEDYERARELLEESLVLTREIGARADISPALTNLAEVCLFEGDEEQAFALHTEARKLAEQIGARKSLAIAHVNLGTIHLRRGEHEAAGASYQRARSEAEAIGAREVGVNALTGLAQVQVHLGQHTAAIATARAAVGESKVMLGGLGEEQGAAARAPRLDTFAVGVRAAIASSSATDTCFFLESGRAGALLESLGGRNRIRATEIPAHLRELEEEARAAERVARWHLGRARASGKLEEVRARRRELNAAGERVRNAIERIRREAKAAAGVVYPEADSLAEIQARLQGGEALVLYGLFREEAVAFVIERARTRAVALGATETIRRAARLGAEDRNSAPAARVTALRELIWTPLELSEEVKRVLVAPDGSLGYVPCALLVGDRELAYVPSGTTYGVLIEERRKSGKGILALGDPDYGTRLDPAALTLMRSGRKLTPLPATREEVQRIGDVKLLAAMATKKQLLSALEKRPRWRAVHLACHGFVDPERPLLSALAITPGEEDDGFVTCLDILRMRILSDLVVLSACETGKGKIYRAEGIVGLTRAFMLAGAPRVICSLWKVDDEATRALMVKFYELWKPGKMSTALALKKAKEHVRSQKKWEHPYYWAAWQLWGLPD